MIHKYKNLSLFHYKSLTFLWIWLFLYKMDQSDTE